MGHCHWQPCDWVHRCNWESSLGQLSIKPRAGTLHECSVLQFISLPMNLYFSLLFVVVLIFSLIYVHMFLQLDSLFTSSWFIECFSYPVVTPHAVLVPYCQKGILYLLILDYIFSLIFGQHSSSNQFYHIGYMFSLTHHIPTYSKTFYAYVSLGISR